MKIIVLSDLVARSPSSSDWQAVSALLAACAEAEGEEDSHQDQIEELRSVWQRQDFHLQSDAYLILSRRGQTVGYGALWLEEPSNGRFKLCVRVHPDYRNRGIGTLLLRLLEQRARALIAEASAPAATLATCVAEANQAACELLEQEGYRLVKSFWRIVINLRDSSAAWPSDGRLTLELDEQPPSPTAKQPVGRPALVGRWRLYAKPLHTDSRLRQSEGNPTSPNRQLRKP